MGTPYQQEFMFTTSVDNQIVPLDFPGRAILAMVTIVRIGGGDIAADIYNRAFTSDPADIKSITNNGNGQAQIRLWSPLLVRAGDALTVAGVNVGGYNTTHRVTAVIDDFPVGRDGPLTLVTDVDYISDGAGGTAALAIPTAEQVTYHVTDQIVDTDNAEDFPEVAYNNLDPLPNCNTGVNRVLYMQMANAGTYKVAISAMTGVGLHL